MITHTWTQKINFDKNPKNFQRQNAKTQLSLSKLSFDNKYWLNFLELPFLSRHQRPETRPDFPHKRFFPLTSYLASICIPPEQIPTPESKVISLPVSASVLAHLGLTVNLQHLESALLYPTSGCRVERVGVGYPRVPLSNYQPTIERNCARLSDFTGRWIPRWPGVGFRCRQFVEVVELRG